MQKHRGRARLAAVAIITIAFAPSLSGCGPTLYLFNILPASSVVHQAEQTGAPEHAPYEYWMAHEYLEKAAEEANEGQYMDAIRYAERAQEFGRQAQERTTASVRAESERQRLERQAAQRAAQEAETER